MEGRRSTRSIPCSVLEVSPRAVKPLPLLRSRVGAALRVAMTLLRQTWEGVDLRDRSRTQRRGFTSLRNIVAAAPTSRRSCVARRHDAATADLEGRRSSRSIPRSASEVSPRDVNLGRASIYEIDLVLSVGGLTTRRKLVAAAPTSRQSCAARRHDAATANLEGRRSTRSIPYSASEVSPRAVKSLPLLRPRLASELRCASPRRFPMY